MKRFSVTVLPVTRFVLLLGTGLAFVAAPVAGQTGYRVDPQGKDELWDVTTKMEMAGMPMAMPAQSSRVCVEKGNDEAVVPRNEECRMTESSRSGNRFSFKMACKNRNSDYTGTGEITYTANGYDGKMRMAGKMEGEPMEMTMTYAGTRAGRCVSTAKQDVAAAKTQSDKLVADSCRDALDKLQWQLWLNEPKATCAGGKAEFCGAVGRAAQSMQDPAQYNSIFGKNPDVRTSFEKCGQDFAATTKAACARGVEARNWSFVASGRCDDEVKTTGDANCKGRSFTAIPRDIAPLCSRYASVARAGMAGGSTDAAQRTASPAQSPAPAPKQPSATDTVQEGVNTLRKLLPF